MNDEAFQALIRAPDRAEIKQLRQSNADLLALLEREVARRDRFDAQTQGAQNEEWHVWRNAARAAITKARAAR